MPIQASASPSTPHGAHAAATTATTTALATTTAVQSQNGKAPNSEVTLDNFATALANLVNALPATVNPNAAAITPAIPTATATSADQKQPTLQAAAPHASVPHPTQAKHFKSEVSAPDQPVVGTILPQPMPTPITSKISAPDGKQADLPKAVGGTATGAPVVVEGHHNTTMNAATPSNAPDGQIAKLDSMIPNTPAIPPTTDTMRLPSAPMALSTSQSAVVSALPAITTTIAQSQITASASLPTQPAPLAATPAAQLAPVLLHLGTTEGARHITLQLTPDQLGRVDINIDQPKGGTTTVRLTAENPHTLALLQQDHTNLTAALDRAGLPTADRVVSFHLAQPQSTSADPGASSQSQSGSMSFANDSQNDANPRQPRQGGGTSQQNVSTQPNRAAIQPAFLPSSGRTALSGISFAGLNITA